MRCKEIVASSMRDPNRRISAGNELKCPPMIEPYICAMRHRDTFYDKRGGMMHVYQPRRYGRTPQETPKKRSMPFIPYISRQIRLSGHRFVCEHQTLRSWEVRITHMTYGVKDASNRKLEFAYTSGVDSRLGTHETSCSHEIIPTDGA